MPSITSTRFQTILILLVLALVAGGLLALSPAEATLGDSVRLVYLHVALTRAGVISLYAAGLLGLALTIREMPRLESWLAPVSRAGLGFFAAGFAVSTAAQRVIWGGISWQEPRMVAALNVLAVGAIVQVLIIWIGAARIRRLLHALMAAVTAGATLTAQNVLHPGDAIGSSESLAIRLYSYALLATCLAAAGWIAWQMRRPVAPPATRPESA